MPFLICLKSDNNENKHKIKSPSEFMEWIAEQEIFNANVATVSSIQESERKTTLIKLKNIWKQYLPVPGKFKKEFNTFIPNLFKRRNSNFERNKCKECTLLSTLGAIWKRKCPLNIVKWTRLQVLSRLQICILPLTLFYTFSFRWLFTLSTYYQT